MKKSVLSTLLPAEIKEENNDSTSAKCQIVALSITNIKIVSWSREANKHCVDM